MAESDNAWWSGQFVNNIVETIKQHSEQMFHATRRDLTEMAITVQADTSSFFSGASSQLSSLWDRGDNDGIEIDRGDDFDDTMVKDEESCYRSELERELNEEPDDPEFEQWKENFSLDQYNDQITELLAENSEVRGLHSTLVPSTLSTNTFWERYFFHQHVVNMK